MIKLKDILLEAAGAMPKNKWITLSGKALDKFKDEISDLINIAYKDIGGHANFKSSKDITNNDMQVWHAVDLDDDPGPDAVNIYKKKKFGHKSVGMGHDGSPAAKSSVIKNKVSLLKKSGWFVEVNEKLYNIFKSRGINAITSEKAVRRVLKGKDIKWLGDGWYIRSIGGDSHKKIMMGVPKGIKGMGSGDEGTLTKMISIYNALF